GRGFGIDVAEAGHQALAALETIRYDAIILDLGLPDLDGLQVLKHRAQCSNTPPIIVLTARDSVQSKIDGLNAGADNYVLKPVNIEELEARIKAVLRRSGR